MAIRSETRTIHTITIPLPDDIIGKIQQGDQVEILFTSSVMGGDMRTPRPMPLPWRWTRYLLGKNSSY